MATRLGVDVGGTFTDLDLLRRRDRRVRVGEGRDHPEAPDEGVTALVAAAVAGGARWRPPRYFLHGTTVGLNALLERRGARRRPAHDARASATSSRCAAASARRPVRPRSGRPPPPLVPRALRLPVTRAASAPTGASRTPLDAGRRARGAATSSAPRASSRVAVVFMQRVRQPRARARRPSGCCARPASTATISLSHRVSGEYREYERTSTTVIDAYVRPAVSALPATARGAAARARLRRRLPRHALRRRRDDLRRGGAAAVRDDHVRARSPARSGAGELCRELGDRERDHRRRRRHELRHLPDRRRAAAGQVRGRASTACRCRRRGSTSARSAPAAARSPTSTRAGCCASARAARAPIPARPATAAAASEPTVTDAARSSGMLGDGRARGRARRSTRDAARARARRRSADAARARRLERGRARRPDDRQREHGGRDPRRSPSSRARIRARRR